MEANPYDVLGIRPSAGMEEIELAYKGRRSQYHPDRYVEADAETREWATEKMKEVNEAYRVLTSPEQRAVVDTQRSRARDSVSTMPPAESTSVDFEAALLNPKWSWVFDKVYRRPNIPRKKFDGARASYAPQVAFDDVLVLVDDTVFGGAREGMLVTRDGLYARQKFEEPKVIRWDGVRDVTPTTSSRVIVNGAEFFKADIAAKDEVTALALRLGLALKEIRTGPVNVTKSTDRRAAIDVNRIYQLHRRALTSARDQLDDQTLLVDVLIEEQMLSLIPIIPTIAETVSSFAKSDDVPIEAELAEGLIGMFLALHYFSLSQLPDAFRSGLGASFTGLHECSEAYKIAYMKQFPSVFQRSMRMKDDDVMAMALMFFHRDGEGEFDLRMPRRQVLESMLARMGLKPAEARDLVYRFEDLAKAWLPKLYAFFAAQD